MIIIIINSHEYDKLDIREDAKIHTIKKHGVGNEKKANQIPVTDTDFDLISVIIEQFDEYYLGEIKGGQQRVVFKKKFSNKNYHCICTLSNPRKRTLFFTTMYIKEITL